MGFEVGAVLQLGDIRVASTFDVELNLLLICQGVEVPSEVVIGAFPVAPSALGICSVSGEFDPVAEGICADSEPGAISFLPNFTLSEKDFITKINHAILIKYMDPNAVDAVNRSLLRDSVAGITLAWIAYDANELVFDSAGVKERDSSLTKDLGLSGSNIVLGHTLSPEVQGVGGDGQENLTGLVGSARSV